MDVNLAKISPVKVTQALREVGSDIVKKVNKVANGLATECFNAAQATRLKKLTSLGNWDIKVEYPKSAKFNVREL